MTRQHGDNEWLSYTDEIVAYKLKEALESNQTEELMEKKSNHFIIKEELDKIDDHLEKTTTSEVIKESENRARTNSKLIGIVQQCKE